MFYLCVTELSSLAHEWHIFYCSYTSGIARKHSEHCNYEYWHMQSNDSICPLQIVTLDVTPAEMTKFASVKSSHSMSHQLK